MADLAVRVAELNKTFRVPERDAGLRAAARSLVRRRHREVRAVDGISFAIEPGEVVGFIGPNGAGKTTTLAGFAGWKVVTILLWLPIAVVFWLLFDPVLDPTLLEVAVFSVAIWGAYLIRTMFLSTLGMITFWTTRVSAIFELAIALELLLSGRLVPLPLMPDWAEDVAALLPFQWSFYFPIQSLVGDLSTGELLGGLAIQALWVAVLTGLTLFVWRFAIRRYSAVGN